MSDLNNLYNSLLEVYTEQVEKLKSIKDENEHIIHWNAASVLNRRMFTYDEYLKNPFYSRFCYEEKNKIMPHLVKFVAAYEVSKEEIKDELKSTKITNEYQEHLDTLIFDTIPMLEFLNAKLEHLQDLEYKLEIPHAPKKKNATRQMAKYKLDKEKYWEDRESIDRCRKEVNDRIILFEQFKKVYSSLS